ncbi:MAG: hypothetical protein NTU63_00410 [Candidatus Pacearchaeota archaeon]|nr:hypothetical protein [Candidatus Pacearchaeota archaeon]
MVNVEIFCGLRGALERGETLKRAMMTFYNAGYKREEISEAAALLKDYQPGPRPKKPVTKEERLVKPKLDQPTLTPVVQQKVEKPKPVVKEEPKLQPQIQQPVVQPPPKKFAPQFPAQAYYIYPTQTTPPQQYPTGVSSYGQEPQRNKTMIYVLIFLLVFLVGLLATIFIFREQLVNFVSNMFS